MQVKIMWQQKGRENRHIVGNKGRKLKGSQDHQNKIVESKDRKKMALNLQCALDSDNRVRIAAP